MRIINAYGYDVTGSEDILNEIETGLKDGKVTINWNNFQNGDIIWNHDGNIKFFENGLKFHVSIIIPLNYPH